VIHRGILHGEFDMSAAQYPGFRGVGDRLDGVAFSKRLRHKQAVNSHSDEKYVPRQAMIQLFEALENRTLLNAVTQQPAIAISPMPDVSWQAVSVAEMTTLDSPVLEQSVAGIPALSSRPGAAYTIYLDFGGFSFTGNWGGDPSQTPGVTPAYDSDGNANAFSAAEITAIQKIWSRVAEKYAEFNINVTTVDPAATAGLAYSDQARQIFYDTQAQLMHTVIGGLGSWMPGAGGVSHVNTTPYSYTGAQGWHTNWVFSAQAPTSIQFISEAVAHENGHGLNLFHQGDFNGTTLVNEYSQGTSAVAPIMGVAFYATRGLWAVGASPSIQNDVQIIANLPGMGGYFDDGIGNTMATATPIPMVNDTVESFTAKGTIVPLSVSNPTPTGASNYTDGWWSFSTSGGLVSLNAVSGQSTITAGTADAGATLDITVELYDAGGMFVSSYASSSSLSVSFSTALAAGTYYVKISPEANVADTRFTKPRYFFDMGDYFLTGTIPTPSTPMASISVSPTAVEEDGQNNLAFTFTRSMSSSQPLTINFNASGTAIFGNDFTVNGADYFDGSTGQVTIPANATSVALIVNPIGDSMVELDETVKFTITSGVNYTLGAVLGATGTILNDDLPTVTVAVSPAAVYENSDTAMVYTFTRDVALSTPLTVYFNIGGTAEYFVSDYYQTGAKYFSSSANLGIVTIPANANSATISVIPMDDNAYELDETVILSVFNVTSYVGGTPSSATATILNNDIPAVSVSVSPAAVNEDSGTPMLFTFDRGAAAPIPLTFGIAFDGTAGRGADYVISPAPVFNNGHYRVTIPANASSITFQVTPIADIHFETDETVIFRVIAGSVYYVGSPSTATGTIVNDEPPPMSVTVAPSQVYEDGSANLVFTITRTGDLSAPRLVPFLVDSSATFGEDFTASGATTFTATVGSVTIPANAASVDIIIDPIVDAVYEINEYVSISLTESGLDPSFPLIANGLILNEDPAIPTIGTLTTSASVVNVGGKVTITASNVTAVDPSRTITKVEFYRDNNANGLIDPTIDTLVGTDTSSSGGWSVTPATTGWPMGTQPLLARALSSNNSWSEPAQTSIVINGLPTLSTITASATAVTPSSPVTLTVANVSDPNDTATLQMYFDANNNGKIDLGIDQSINVSINSAGLFEGQVTSPATIGTYKYLARARDSFGALSSSTLSATVVVTTPPRIEGGLTATPNPVQRGLSFTVNVSGAIDDDGTIASVSYYRDIDGDGQLNTAIDKLLVADTTASNGWNNTISSTNTLLITGVNHLLAVAKDNRGISSAPVTTDVLIDPPPTVGSFTIAPAVLAPDQSFVLTAATTSADTVAASFYFDSNNNSLLDATDPLVGSDTDGSDGYKVSVPAAGMTLGTVRFFTVVLDNYNFASAARSATAVISSRPRIDGPFTASPNPVANGQTLTLTADNVVDDDGTVASVSFYRDVNGDGAATAADLLLGTDTSSASGWTYSVNSSSPNLITGVNRLLAVATDNVGTTSAPVLTLVTIDPPPLQFELDNTAATLVGSWTSGTSKPGFVGSNYQHDGNASKGTKTATYTPTLSAGRYSVSVNAPTGFTATNVPVDIYSNNVLLATVTWNQTVAGWRTLGTYDFAATGNKIVIRTNGTSGFVVIDAVRFTSEAPVTGPEVDVQGNGVSIIDGAATPSTANGTDLGSAVVGATMSATYIARNLGTTALSLGSITLPSGFSIDPADTLASSLAPGASDTFRVLVDTSTAGTKSGQISIVNDDSGENPYNFSVTATVTLAGATVVELDNTAATLVGSWTASTSKPGFVGSNYQHDGNASKGTKTATYTPTLSAGRYSVSVNAPTGFTATNVPVDIYSNNVLLATVTWNQTVAGWRTLGTFDFAATGNKLVIRTTGTSGFVVIDAVRFTPA
jgi:hypothetical protein